MEYIENAFEKIEKIGGYPSPFATPEQKEKKEYGLAYFKCITTGKITLI